MQNHKKTLLASLITFFIGTSCCWLSALLIWLGGLASLGVFITCLEYLQTPLLLLSIALLLTSLFLFWKKR